MTFARSERAELCGLLDKVGADAPTRCEGWDAHDLAAHLWIRENDPIAVGGIVAKPLTGLYERRLAEVKQRWEFGDLVDRIRRGPVWFSVFAIPGVDEGRNTTEFFIHHEDVRRAGDPPLPGRDLGREVEDWMWRRLKLMARAWFRRVPVGVVLERAGGSAGSTSGDAPETIRAMAGPTIVNIVGLPSELMIYAHGRRWADVRVHGEPEAIALLDAADLST